MIISSIPPKVIIWATKKAGKAIGFRIQDKVVGFEQLDLKYNRPDKVLKVLQDINQLLETEDTLAYGSDAQKVYRLAYEKRVRKAGFDHENLDKQTLMDAPSIRLVDVASQYIQAKKQDFEFSMDAEDKTQKLSKLHVWVNGVPIYTTKGMDLAAKNIQSIHQEVVLRLSEGKNLIEASVFNQLGIESIRESFTVDYTPAQTTKPNLHIITIGVSKYSNQDFNLQYADKDAQELKTLFESQNANFSQIYTYSLTNEQATKANIMALKEKLKNSSVDDHVYIFFSGHGVLNKDLDYYLATHDIDFSNPQKKGLLYDDFESLLDGIPARQKVLLVDACHSGEVDKDETELKPKEAFAKVEFTKSGNTNVTQKTVGMQNSFELMKELFTDLRRSTGATVISAAGGVQFAYEGINGLKNGVFTHCIKEGLANKAADLNKDGQIVLSELQHYVAGQVVLLTGGKQQPTSRIENLVNDFRVW